MPEIIPIRENPEYRLKYGGLSVEQLVLKDYAYFKWMVDKLEKGEKFRDFRKSLKNRIDEVYYKVNNFKSVKNCSCDNCQNPAQRISIYHSGDERISGLDFIYCSEKCYQKDPKVEWYKSGIKKLGFNSALSPTKDDTNRLVKIIAECMGLDPSKKFTKKYLEEFFYHVETLEPYKGQLSLF